MKTAILISASLFGAMGLLAWHGVDTGAAENSRKVRRTPVIGKITAGQPSSRARATGETARNADPGTEVTGSSDRVAASSTRAFETSSPEDLPGLRHEPASSGGSARAVASGRARLPVRSGLARLPLVFQDPEPGSVVLTPAQEEGTKAAEEAFADATGEPADPSTPEIS